ncbi:unnamed protein product [Effrenium voratum]|nr:unnamed protein product [Effrenium voratum]
MASPWHTLGRFDVRPGPTYLQHLEQLHTASTAIGKCRLDTVGHLKPCDDRHAPIRLYRSYGEWFEAGLKAPATNLALETTSSRFWPYGQDVTKLHQTVDKKHQYRLDDRTVQSVKPYIPPRDSSLPDLRAYRQGGSRHDEALDLRYHQSFRDTGKRIL